MKKEKCNKELMELVSHGVSPFHAVDYVTEQLKEEGYEELRIKDKWKLKKGGKYYIIHHGTTLIAFTIGKEFEAEQGFRIAASHTDFPCFRIKINPEMTEEKYEKLNVESYGGLILNTWMDRPLSVAGRVALKSNDVFRPNMKLVDLKKQIATIPNLAIHMNRDINKGVELNKQTDTLPVVGMFEEEKEKKEFFLKYLAKELGVEKEEIINFDLNLYVAEQPSYVGMEDEFISAPRLDNMTSVHAVQTALLMGERKQGINVGAFFDHEEIGSKTKQGAGSMLLNHIMEKIYLSLGYSELEYKSAMDSSMLLAVDVGHGYHPNQNKKHDPVNKGALNGGVSIKQAASQSYATDSEGIAVVTQICEKYKIKHAQFTNRSDGTSGSTLGSIASAMLPVMTVDVGVPLVAMHSARELMGSEDQLSLVKLVKEYFAI
ncbi:MAG: M18 family aminopeptidase [Lachnospiraceae bacterium]|nr:M18 family aminopeptidase [Lachnospiraceae bacterium]